MDETEARFLEAVQRDPEDDEVRRVYADWLEERGDPRGEYLRIELQLYRLPPRLAQLATGISQAWLNAIGRSYRVVLVEAKLAINTIKIVREVTGLGLKDSKDLVDATRAGGVAVIRTHLDRQAADELAAKFTHDIARVRIETCEPVTPASQPVPGCTVRLVSVTASRRIEAIKIVREWTDLGLRDARDLVDAVHAGSPAILREGVDPATANTIAGAFADIGEVRIDESFLRR